MALALHKSRKSIIETYQQIPCVRGSRPAPGAFQSFKFQVIRKIGPPKSSIRIVLTTILRTTSMRPHTTADSFHPHKARAYTKFKLSQI